MIFLIVFGGLMLILGGFYLANSWQEYREWRGGTIIVVLSLIAVIYGLINLPNWQHQRAKNRESQPTTQTVTQATPANKFSQMQQADNPEVQKQRENIILRQMQKNYEKLGSVSFDSKTKTYQVTPSGDAGKATSYLAKHPDQAGQIGWNKLTGPIQESTKSLKKALGTGYSISIMNPDNSSQALFTAKDGQATYNIVK